MTSDKSKNLAIKVQYLFYFTVHIRHTVKDYITCIFYIYLVVLIMMLQVKNEKGVRLVALFPNYCNLYKGDNEFAWSI